METRRSWLEGLVSETSTCIDQEWMGHEPPSLRARLLFLMGWLAMRTILRSPGSLRSVLDFIPMRPPANTLAIPDHVDGVPAEWLVPLNERVESAVLYLHGGAYTSGSPKSHRKLCGRIARAGGARVLSLDYRLAPRHPFPAALEDALKGYHWLLREGYPSRQIIVAGDSAGGGLALALLLLLRDRGDPLPAGAALISPWTDLLGTGLAIAGRARIDPLLRWDDLKARAAEYAGRHGLADPLISPLYGDFRGLPPLLILVGTREILYDDSTRLALRACQAGVPVTLVVGGGMPHVWPAYARFIPEGRQAIGRIGLFIRQTQMHGSGRHLLADEGDLRLPDLVVGDEVDLPG